MKHLLSIKNILAVVLIALVWFGIFQVSKEIARHTEKGVVPGYLLSIRSDGIHKLEKIGYMKEVFIGTYQFEGVKIENRVSDEERYHLMMTGKPVSVLWHVPASKIGRSQPFWDDFTYLVFIMAGFMTFVVWGVWDIKRMENKYGKPSF